MKTPLQKPRMQPLAKHQTSPPSWHVLTLLTFGPWDLEENRCLNPCTLITYLVTDPISSLGQLNELPVKCQTSAFICTLLFVYFGIKPRFFNITWHELQLGWKWSRLKAWNFPGATTLTQQLVKMMHFLSPRPPPPVQCSRYGFKSFSTQSTLLRGRGDSRIRLFQQHFQAFITD